MMQFLTDCFVLIQGWLFDTLVQPVLFALGLASYVEMGFEGIEFALLGVIELTIAYALMRPLEAWWPAEHWTQRRAVRVDVIYSVLNRLGIIPLAVFALLASPIRAAPPFAPFFAALPPRIAMQLARAPLLLAPRFRIVVKWIAHDCASFFSFSRSRSNNNVSSASTRSSIFNNP